MKGRVVMLLANAMTSDPRVEKEAVALVSAGWDITVLAWDREGDEPAREERDGYRIERLGPRAAYGGGVRSLPAFTRFWRASAERVVAQAPDVVHCHDLDTAPAGIGAVRKMGRGSLVMDFHELYRESNMVPQRGAKGTLAKAVVRVIERRALSRADVVLVANPGTVSYYEDLGVRGALITLENAPDASMFRPRPRASNRTAFTIGYAGQKRYLGGLLTLVEAVAGKKGMNAVLAGGGVAAEELARAAEGFPNIEVSGRFAYSDLARLYERFDVVYAVYEAPIGNVRTLFPVKVMEAMACALPVIVSAGTWIGDYVSENRIGLAVPPGDVAALEGVLERLRDRPDEAAEMGSRGRALVEDGLNWAHVSSKLVAAYDALLVSDEA